ncbi:MAG: RdgB/HAM1 family non-canonical purine NTP pyrophosphatase [Candidatus Obscuribacterales bacterium]|jgi:XTP/dITP diphosphohydrolase|nr:RdgB/HAM1 family non-canonical purine NTP pyrophosphatase [Candidatus Obscuribacterales bacterium]
MRIVLATTNQGKLKEFSALAENESWLNLELAPEDFNVNESGNTFFENAKLKAVTAAKLTGLTSIADDSGLVVEALNGKPGVHSARYCPGSDADRRQKLLKDMEAVPENRRQAAFFCAMVVSNPDGSIAFNTMRCWEGMIGYKEAGDGGFGYDPIFYLPQRKITVAQLPAIEKNLISHRGQAWKQVLNYLKELAQK